MDGYVSATAEGVGYRYHKNGKVVWKDMYGRRTRLDSAWSDVSDINAVLYKNTLAGNSKLSDGEVNA